jgi:hypothetical protein
LNDSFRSSEVLNESFKTFDAEAERAEAAVEPPPRLRDGG